MRTLKYIALVCALLLLLAGCGDDDTLAFMDGHWHDRPDVPFVTAMEYGFYAAQGKQNIPCTMEFESGWNGPQAPGDDQLPEDHIAFTAVGYLDILEPHEGANQMEVYESRMIHYLAYNEDVGIVIPVSGYMDEGIDDMHGSFDADTSSHFITLYYDYYDEYVSTYGAPF